MTTTYDVKFPDGAAAQIVLTASHANELVDLQVSGEVGRLDLPKSARSTVLWRSLADQAHALKAQLVTTETGEWPDEDDVK